MFSLGRPTAHEEATPAASLPTLLTSMRPLLVGFGPTVRILSIVLGAGGVRKSGRQARARPYCQARAPQAEPTRESEQLHRALGFSCFSLRGPATTRSGAGASTRRWSVMRPIERGKPGEDQERQSSRAVSGRREVGARRGACWPASRLRATTVLSKQLDNLTLLQVLELLKNKKSRAEHGQGGQPPWTFAATGVQSVCVAEMRCLLVDVRGKDKDTGRIEARSADAAGVAD